MTKPHGNTEIVYNFKEVIHMPKLAQISPAKIFIIGGATDIKGHAPIRQTLLLDPSNKEIRPIRVNDMNKCRVSHGI